MTAVSSNQFFCNCGARNDDPAAAYCWMCGQPIALRCDCVSADKLSGNTLSATTPSAGAAIDPGAILLGLTLVAICLGLFFLSPVAAVGLLILVAPALIRVSGIAERHRQLGRPLGTPQKIGAFVASMGVVLAIIVASTSAFFAVCLASGQGGEVLADLLGDRVDEVTPYMISFVVGTLLGGVVAFYSASRLVRLLWRTR